MRNDRSTPSVVIISILLPLVAGQANAAEKGATFLDVVQKYADTMIERCRDTYGSQKSMLFLSAFDRMTMAPLTTRPAGSDGVRRGDRSGSPWSPMTGANPHLDENLLRIMYTLTEITGDKRYAQAADDELKWFFNNAASPVTHLLSWGEHLSWDVILDKTVSGGTEVIHEFARPWLLWDRSWELAPEACKNFALGLWEHQIADHKTGAYDRHAKFFEHGPTDGMDFPRHGAFYIGTWCYAYKYTKEQVFLEAIEAILARFERKRKKPDGSMVLTMGPLECEIAAGMVPDPLASRLRAFAAQEDELKLAEIKDAHYTATWQAGYGTGGVTALRAMDYLARYEQVPKQGYRDAIIAIANAYKDAWPDEDIDAWPMSFGHVISTMVAAYQWTNDEVYLREAKRVGQFAVQMFWQDNPLPRASFKIGHYEAITGGDSLALALLQIHAAEHHLKVNIPSNTIDR